MNPTSADPTAVPPPAQPPRSSFSCDRHPTEQFTGFCPSCLCERLTTLDQSSSNTPSSSRRPSSASAAAAAAIKSLFSKPSNPAPPPPKPSRPSSFFPELRRSKSFSASKNEALALGLSFEPQRKSCDVRARSTLSSLFTLDGGGKTNHKPSSIPASSVASTSHHHNPQIRKKPEPCIANKPVFEEIENEEDFKDFEKLLDDANSCDGDEIRPLRDTHLENLRNPVEIETIGGEIVEEEEEVASVGNNNASKPIKDHINLDTQEKKSGFWAAASVFSKKWTDWRRKQKLKKPSNGEDRFATLPVEKPISRQYRETQSEIADYGFGRRSCDTDPRFSLDAGRISFDDPRYSFDEPRASWDGYLIGKSFSRMAGPPMVSVMEDTPNRPDMQIPLVEESSVNCDGEGESVVLPGGSIQTRDYYLDSSSRRRKSLDRSSSVRTSLAGEIDELKSLASNARVSPTTADGFHGAKAMSGETNSYKINLRDSNSNSFRDDGSEAFELGSNGFIRNNSSNSLIGNGDKKESKKCRRWSWRIWGFIHRRNNNNKYEDEEVKYGGRANGVERSLSESWQDFRTDSGDLRVPRLSRNMLRSNSSVSWRNSNGNHHVGGSFGSMRKSGVEVNGKRKDEFVLERNRSARYSPNNIDNGLLRFYLTPLSNSRRGGGLTKVKPNNSHSVARSVLRLY